MIFTANIKEPKHFNRIKSRSINIDILYSPTWQAKALCLSLILFYMPLFIFPQIDRQKDVTLIFAVKAGGYREQLIRKRDGVFVLQNVTNCPEEAPTKIAHF